ncbi:Metallophosphoesterase domain-containing protein 1 [Colletotrichum sidae]|uniref:Metallophosphoesterase domain-containing protein 1 n=1 Tax=Colletotrichum sidae TaxID=1347389 RepID=A0A4V3I2G7_9PEZI|nr:Metallophosphoesterase domain-containing protein 1 [Colletotrichum sidae]
MPYKDAVVRFLVLSDTHDNAYPDPYAIPPADVVLHCGDLTNMGGMSNYENAIHCLSEFDAELKLVIPGNHDIALDPSRKQFKNQDEHVDEEYFHGFRNALDMFKGYEKHTGIRLLAEGTHHFTLRDGRFFSVYASPYIPGDRRMAFRYEYEEDRFNPGTKKGNPIPEGVDIVMTHGPPLVPHRGYDLDVYDSGHHGCVKLWNAVQRTRPLLHCFGHVHDAYGAQRLSWNNEKWTDGIWSDNTTDTFTLADVPLPDIGFLVADPMQTLLVNAALKTHDPMMNDNAPILVDIECRYME